MADVERIVRRDYPADVAPDILGEIERTEVREKARVVLACLKIANGDRRRLQAALQDAPGYYRDILSEAEYPLATKRWSRMPKLADEDRRRVYESDWKQYIVWLGREPAS